MARDEKGRFTGIEKADSGEKADSADGDSTPKRPSYDDMRKVEEPLDVDQVEDAYSRPREGLTVDEAETKLEDVLGDLPEASLEGYLPEDADEGDPDALRDALNKLRSEGSVEAATKALEALDALEAGGSPDDAEDGEDGEPVPWEALAEAAGLDADRVMVQVKVQGEEMEVPLSEAIGGYQREADYTRKSQELAERREELGQVLDQSAQRLELVNAVFRQSMTPEQQAALGQAYQRVQAEREAVLAHRLQQEVLPQEHQRLRERLGWESDEDVQAGKELIATAAVEHYGFTPEDLQGVYDHRLLHLAHDAAKYREMVARQEEAKKEVRSKRRKSGTLKPGTKGGRKKSRRSSEARKQLARSGRVEDAAAALDSILPDDII